MNRVAITGEEIPLPRWIDRVPPYILKVLQYLHRDGWDLSILFCNDASIRALNSRYRNLDEPTDVLSFVLGETIEDAGERRYVPGDIVISLETLGENARYFKVDEDEELRRLLIHGILHLDGLDHDTNADNEPMLQAQEKIMAELAGERILP
ncbi:MAG: rRNA maturation RNase YbeY [Treponema sp.]|jgi:probable rRNA maturation factor|nr:rRNA maturation RNase YbeY [Treponema sp.]